MNNLFYTDVNNILMEYAGLKDMMNIKKVIPDMKLAKNSIDKKIIQTINIRLQKVFGGKLESFKTFLEDTQSIISGSFIMQCVLKEEYENSDIDVYVCYKNIGKMKGFFNLNHENINSYHNPSYDLIVSEEFKITNVYNFYIWPTSVQFILVNTEEPSKFTSLFDIDICKNVYGIKDGKEYIDIHNFDMLYEKKGNIVCNIKLDKHMERYYKYTGRGFSLNKIIHNDFIKSTIDSNNNIYRATIVSEIDDCLKIKYLDNAVGDLSKYDKKFDHIHPNQLALNTLENICQCNNTHCYACDDPLKNKVFSCWTDTCILKFFNMRHIHCDEHKFILLT